MLALFLTLVMAVLLGCVALTRLSRGLTLLPAGIRRRTRHPLRLRRLAAALLAGILVAAVTRWPVAAMVAAVLTWVWPKVAGAGAVERTGVAKLEALAGWTESLRDVAQAASGLEHAIPATLEAAPRLLERPLRTLVHRLAARVPLPEALALFADDVDDPGADMVVAALSLNARQRAGSLSRVLTTLATHTRAELEVRRKVLLERTAVRRNAMQVAGIILVFAAGTALVAPGWVAPYGTPLGQVILAGIAALYLALLMRLRRLATPEQQPRFLGDPDTVAEVASHRPRAVVGP